MKNFRRLFSLDCWAADGLAMLEVPGEMTMKRVMLHKEILVLKCDG